MTRMDPDKLTRRTDLKLRIATAEGLVAKLSDTMDPDGARAFVEEVICSVFAANLDEILADVEQRTDLKLRIANVEGDFPFGTMSALNVARALIADCKDRAGVIHEDSLLQEINRIVTLLFRAQGRLPLFKDVVTGKVSDR